EERERLLGQAPLVGNRDPDSPRSHAVHSVMPFARSVSLRRITSEQKNRNPSGTGRGEGPPGTHALPAHQPPATRQGRVMVMMRGVVHGIHGPEKLPATGKPSRARPRGPLTGKAENRRDSTAPTAPFVECGMDDPIRIRGARQHNLKNIDVD